MRVCRIREAKQQPVASTTVMDGTTSAKEKRKLTVIYFERQSIRAFICVNKGTHLFTLYNKEVQNKFIHKWFSPYPD